jgi:hypothetical protein
MGSRCSVALVAITACMLGGNATAQDAMTVGELKGVAAWVDKMPPGPPSLHVTGSITASTPCHEAVTEHTGDSKTNPPGYMVKVTTNDPGGICIQMLADINFHHVEENYAGSHATAEVSSDSDTETVDIQEVH